MPNGSARDATSAATMDCIRPQTAFVCGVAHHEGCQLRRKGGVDEYVARPGLVEHGDGVALAEGRILGARHQADVGDIALVAYHVAADVAADVLNQAVVAHGNVAQHGAAYARVAGKSLAHFYHLVEQPEAHVAAEGHIANVHRGEILGHGDARPVIGGASLALKGLYLVYCK